MFTGASGIPHSTLFLARRSGAAPEGGGQRRSSRHPPAKEKPRRLKAEQRGTAQQRGRPPHLCVELSSINREEGEEGGEERRGGKGRMPHRARPMTGLLVFMGVNLVLINTISPVYDFVCFNPYWERRVMSCIIGYIKP
uniref:Uncharacterized protein n=1 Tax=Leersia perrieri TaxID=77586 RepID=A0A0D9XNU0_9ORYZ